MIPWQGLINREEDPLGNWFVDFGWLTNVLQGFQWFLGFFVWEFTIFDGGCKAIEAPASTLPDYYKLCHPTPLGSWVWGLVVAYIGVTLIGAFIFAWVNIRTGSIVAFRSISTLFAAVALGCLLCWVNMTWVSLWFRLNGRLHFLLLCFSCSGCDRARGSSPYECHDSFR